MKLLSILKGIWAFCPYVFVPERRPKDDGAARMTRRPLWRVAGLCGERSNVPRDSAVLYGAGMAEEDLLI